MNKPEIPARAGARHSAVGAKAIDAMNGMFFFAFVGPPLGSLAISGRLLLMLLLQGSVASALGYAFAVVFGFAMWSYIFGIVPAAVTGAIVGLLRRRFTVRGHPFAVGLLGSMVGLVVAMTGLGLQPSGWLSALAGQIARRQWQAAWNSEVMLFLIVPGFVGGALTSLLYRRALATADPLASGRTPEPTRS